ncbi:MAG: DNA polymerase III subunit delta' [Burkholderiaceae bacterium]|nr:DNA polymerase III subunit delta' [Burkholderiaceae bacterium]
MVHDWLKPAWQQLLAGRDRLHHALLVHGPGGIGKSGFVADLARALLCDAPLPDGAACGRCAACGWFDQRNHPDFRLLTPAAMEEARESEEGATDEGSSKSAGKGTGKPSREIRVEQVRALERFTAVGGHRGGHKIIVIDPADALNVVAANALLKTLEEPSGSTRFVLVTSRPDALPATIRSRCRLVSLPMPAPATAVDWLARDAGVEPAQARAWLAAAGGAPLHARRLADPAQAAIHRTVMEALAGIPETGIEQTADALTGIETPVWAGMLQRWIVDLQRVRAGAEPRYFPDRAPRLQALTRRTGLPALERLARQIDELVRTADHPLNPRLVIEDALLRVRAALAD